MSTRRSSLIFLSAVVVSNLSQAAWLVAGARVFSGSVFGTTLTALAIYGVLQIVVDNGAGFHGARMAARSALDRSARNELAHVRVLLALAGAVIGLLIATLGGGALLLAFTPFAAALCLFALLNVWEPYGEGHVLPYATYLVLRSLVLAVVVGAFAIGGGGLPGAAVGMCELAAIGLTGSTGSARWLLPRGVPRVRGRTWKSVRDIGVPALIVQYDFAAITIVLGVSGRTAAAAVTGVMFRLLSGLQSVNGAAAAAIFPSLARNASPESGELHVWRLTAWRIVAVSYLGVLAVAILAPLLVLAFLASSGELEQAALVLGVGGAASAGLVLHQSFTLVARGMERSLLRSYAIGAAVITLAGAVAAIGGGQDGPIIGAAGFVVGQGLTLLLLFRAAAVGRDERGADRALLVVASAVIPCIALILALAGEHRIWIAGALAVISAAIAATKRTEWFSAGSAPVTGR